MITFKPVVFAHQRRKDGTYPVKIRVTFARKCRMLPTNLAATPSDLTRSLRIRNQEILDKTEDLIRQMRQAASDLDAFALEGRDVDFVVAHIKETISRKAFRLDFFEFAWEFIKGKKPGTRGVYTSALNLFSEFLGTGGRCDINDITRATAMRFVEWLESRNRFCVTGGRLVESGSPRKAGTTTVNYVFALNHIHNSAKERYNDEDSGSIVIPRSPFSGVAPKRAPATGQRSLGQEVMQMIISDTTSDPALRNTLDTFIVSFGLMGANLVDLKAAQLPKGGTWIYNRAKTRDRRADHSEMRVDIPPELLPFIGRLRTGGPLWMGGLRRDHNINYNLRRWADMHGVEPFTFYAARHTWATLARKAGVEKATVDECLAHVGDFRIADIYAERDWELINQANRKVLDLFTWPHE